MAAEAGVDLLALARRRGASAAGAEAAGASESVQRLRRRLQHEADDAGVAWGPAALYLGTEQREVPPRQQHEPQPRQQQLRSPQQHQHQEPLQPPGRADSGDDIEITYRLRRHLASLGSSQQAIAESRSRLRSPLPQGRDDPGLILHSGGSAAAEQSAVRDASLEQQLRQFEAVLDSSLSVPLAPNPRPRTPKTPGSAQRRRHGSPRPGSSDPNSLTMLPEHQADPAADTEEDPVAALQSLTRETLPLWRSELYGTGLFSVGDSSVARDTSLAAALDHPPRRDAPAPRREPPPPGPSPRRSRSRAESDPGSLSVSAVSWGQPMYGAWEESPPRPPSRPVGAMRAAQEVDPGEDAPLGYSPLGANWRRLMLERDEGIGRRELEHARAGELWACALDLAEAQRDDALRRLAAERSARGALGDEVAACRSLQRLPIELRGDGPGGGDGAAGELRRELQHERAAHQAAAQEAAELRGELRRLRRGWAASCQRAAAAEWVGAWAAEQGRRGAYAAEERGSRALLREQEAGERVRCIAARADRADEAYWKAQAAAPPLLASLISTARQAGSAEGSQLLFSEGGAGEGGAGEGELSTRVAVMAHEAELALVRSEAAVEAELVRAQAAAATAEAEQRARTAAAAAREAADKIRALRGERDALLAAQRAAARALVPAEETAAREALRSREASCRLQLSEDCQDSRAAAAAAGGDAGALEASQRDAEGLRRAMRALEQELVEERRRRAAALQAVEEDAAEQKHREERRAGELRRQLELERAIRSKERTALSSERDEAVRRAERLAADSGLAEAQRAELRTLRERLATLRREAAEQAAALQVERDEAREAADECRAKEEAAAAAARRVTAEMLALRQRVAAAEEAVVTARREAAEESEELRQEVARLEGERALALNRLRRAECKADWAAARKGDETTRAPKKGLRTDWYSEDPEPSTGGWSAAETLADARREIDSLRDDLRHAQLPLALRPEGRSAEAQALPPPPPPPPELADAACGTPRAPPPATREAAAATVPVGSAEAATATDPAPAGAAQLCPRCSGALGSTSAGRASLGGTPTRGAAPPPPPPPPPPGAAAPAPPPSGADEAQGASSSRRSSKQEQQQQQAALAPCKAREPPPAPPLAAASPPSAPVGAPQGAPPKPQLGRIGTLGGPPGGWGYAAAAAGVLLAARRAAEAAEARAKGGGKARRRRGCRRRLADEEEQSDAGAAPEAAAGSSWAGGERTVTVHRGSHSQGTTIGGPGREWNEIAEVTRGSPEELAGVRVGMFISAVNGVRVLDQAALGAALTAAEPTHTLTLRRPEYARGDRVEGLRHGEWAPCSVRLQVQVEGGAGHYQVEWADGSKARLPYEAIRVPQRAPTASAAAGAAAPPPPPPSTSAAEDSRRSSRHSGSRRRRGRLPSASSRGGEESETDGSTSDSREGRYTESTGSSGSSGRRSGRRRGRRSSDASHGPQDSQGSGRRRRGDSCSSRTRPQPSAALATPAGTPLPTPLPKQLQQPRAAPAPPMLPPPAASAAANAASKPGPTQFAKPAPTLVASAAAAGAAGAAPAAGASKPGPTLRRPAVEAVPARVGGPPAVGRPPLRHPELRSKGHDFDEDSQDSSDTPLRGGAGEVAAAGARRTPAGRRSSPPLPTRPGPPAAPPPRPSQVGSDSDSDSGLERPQRHNVHAVDDDDSVVLGRVDRDDWDSE